MNPTMNPVWRRAGALLAVCWAIWQGLSVSEAAAQHITPEVVVAHPVLLPIVSDILEGVTKPEPILQHARDSHDALLSPSDVQKLNRADIIIAVDASLTPALIPWLSEKKNPRAMVLLLGKYDEARLIKGAKRNPFISESKTISEKSGQLKNGGAYDPHLWLDPLRMAALLLPLTKDIAKYSPEFSAKLHYNAQKLALHLRAVTYPKTRDILQKALAEQKQFTPNYPIIPVLTQHDAFAYFYDAYGINNGGYVYSYAQNMLGAASTSKLVTEAKKHRIRCVFISEPNRLMTKIAELSHARTVLVHPEKLVTSHDVVPLGWFQNDYDRFIANISNQFADCLF